ncbi:MAG: zinc ribbon domain-containing protein [Anaerolineae bacterium]
MSNPIPSPITKILVALFFLPLLVASAQAQPEVRLSNLFIQIWPEYDRPETLVIYRGNVADSVPLPVTLTFQLPAGTETMHAVAVFNQSGALVNNPYTLTPAADSVELSFTLDRPEFQFEYYDPKIVIKNGVERNVNFSVAVPYAIANLQLELQQPPEADAVQLAPPPDNVRTGNDQFIYHNYRQQDLPPGAPILITGSYTKPTDSLAVELQLGISQPAAAPESPAGGQGLTATLGYVLVGLGVAALLAAGGFWYYTNRRPAAQTQTRRPARSKRAVKAAKTARARQSRPATQSAQPASPAAESKYCHSCGASYKPQARFCHKCGAPRRE